jgi:hypothetical protein
MDLINNIAETKIFIKKMNVINFKSIGESEFDENSAGTGIMIPAKDRAKLGISVGFDKEKKDRMVLEIEYEFISSKTLSEVSLVFNVLITLNKAIDGPPSSDDVEKLMDKKFETILDNDIKYLNKAINTDMPVISEITDEPKIDKPKVEKS